ncbi:MAG: hypothetical protein ACLRWQ_16920 [Flavonifractor plautii]
MDNGKPGGRGSSAAWRSTGYAGDGAGRGPAGRRWWSLSSGGIRGECLRRSASPMWAAAPFWGRVEEAWSTLPRPVSVPRCLHYTKCGGCQFRHMNYAEELEAKRIRVEDALRRLGGAEIHVSAILGAEQVDRYRNKAQFPVSSWAPHRAFYRPPEPWRNRRGRTACSRGGGRPPAGGREGVDGGVITSAPTTSAPAPAWCATCMCAPTGPAAACAACWSMAGASPGRSSWCAPCAGPSPTWPESCWG